ncbi:MAG: alpha/beta hydrolase [Actinomycetota bacterium]|nr:alpha/beta hydrolase [Actinomycetota bacterium]
MTSPRGRAPAGSLRVAYDDVGSGPPLVFVHGGLGNREMWAPQVRALSATHRCIAYDLRGHGETEGGEEVEAFTPALLRDDLLALADALGLARFALVGLSVGGLVAQEAAIAAPERLSAVVMADTWVVTGGSERERQAGRALTPVVEGALRVLGTGPLAYLAARGMGDRDEEARELVRAATSGTDRGAAIRVWRGLAAHDTRSRLPQVATPALVIAGARDRNLAQARLLASLVQDSELVILPDAGHITNLHQPARFTAAVADFLSRRSPTGR